MTNLCAVRRTALLGRSGGGNDAAAAMTQMQTERLYLLPLRCALANAHLSFGRSRLNHFDADIPTAATGFFNVASSFCAQLDPFH